MRDELESEAFQAQVTNQERFDCWSPCLGGGGGVSLLFIILDGRDIMMIPLLTTISHQRNLMSSYVHVTKDSNIGVSVDVHAVP